MESEMVSDTIQYHQAWRPGHDRQELGGDQFNMALSSWALLYAYTGNPEIVENMRYIADSYLERSLSSASDAWQSATDRNHGKQHFRMEMAALARGWGVDDNQEGCL